MADRSTNHMDSLIHLIDGWRGGRIVVAGDFMLDHHVFGSADRLSPDAPVPVLATQYERYEPGGAANVALDLKALRCEEAVCLGVIGRDGAAERLRSALDTAGCGTAGLIAVDDRPTSLKHNFVGLAQHRHRQKMFRVDEESRAPIPKATQDRLLAQAEKLVPKAQVLCLQDHNKGVLTDRVCQNLIKLAKRHCVQVLIDPAAIDDYRKYRGATCLTPNRFEAALATGRSGALEDESDWHAVARQLRSALRLAAIVLTLDRHGGLLLERSKSPLHMATQAREAYDVTGAGDTVLAMLAAARANGIGWPDAMRLANIAGGLAVEQFGNIPIELDEVLLALWEHRRVDLGKRRSIPQLLPELSAHRKKGRIVVFTNGCFDILHAGHVKFLQEARRQGDLLVVAVNSDASVHRIKGQGRPINRQADRLMVLSELQSVDYLLVFNQNDPLNLIEAIRPDVLVKGGDYQRNQVVGGDLVESYGGKVVLVELVKGRSTTNIIQKSRRSITGADPVNGDAVSPAVDERD